MIHVLAVRSGKFGSRLIRWGIDEEASHLAIECGGWVYHSSVHGVERVDPEEFWAAYEFVRGVRITGNDTDGDGISDLLDEVCGVRRYDYGALAYFAYRAALKKFFGRPMPTRSEWDDQDRDLCVELLYAFFEAYAKIVGKTVTLSGKAFGVMTPLACVAFTQETLGCFASPMVVYSHLRS